MDIVNWLFNDRTGVLVLIGGGIVLFMIIALVLEIKTKKVYFNHEKSADDFTLFDDEESADA